MKIVFIALLLLISSCASYTPGEDADLVQNNSKEKLALSAKLDPDMSFEDFAMINFYFFNNTSKWMRIKNVELVEIENHPDVQVIVGKDLYYWAKSMEYKIAIDRQNRELLLGSLALVGAGVSIAGGYSGSAKTALAGAALTIGTITLAEAEHLIDKANTLERASLIPEGHIYTPFSVPPFLVTTKWILLQKMNLKRMCRLKLKVTFVDGTTTIFNNELTSIRSKCGSLDV